jgi:hypothetical protein
MQNERGEMMLLNQRTMMCLSCLLVVIGYDAWAQDSYRQRIGNANPTTGKSNVRYYDMPMDEAMLKGMLTQFKTREEELRAYVKKADNFISEAEAWLSREKAEYQKRFDTYKARNASPNTSGSAWLKQEYASLKERREAIEQVENNLSDTKRNRQLADLAVLNAVVNQAAISDQINRVRSFAATKGQTSGGGTPQGSTSSNALAGFYMVGDRPVGDRTGWSWMWLEPDGNLLASRRTTVNRSGDGAEISGRWSIVEGKVTLKSGGSSYTFSKQQIGAKQ